MHCNSQIRNVLVRSNKGLWIPGKPLVMSYVIANWWWLRSPNVSNTTNFWNVNNNGNVNNNNASNANGVCP